MVRIGGEKVFKKAKDWLLRRKEQKALNDFLSGEGAYDECPPARYRRLSDIPEVHTAVNRIAEAVSNMSIKLRENGDSGDKTIKNELSRLVDISPSPYTTRRSWLYNIVRNLLIEGEGNAYVLPITKKGVLVELKPLEPSYVTVVDMYGHYGISYKGQYYKYDEIIHFIHNPDPERPYVGRAHHAVLKDVAQNLKASNDVRHKFSTGQYLPPIVVKVDANNVQLSTVEGREKVYNDYIKTKDGSRPWIIPGDMIEVEQIRPMSIKDMAIHENFTLDKKTVASIFGVPAFFLGVGEFSIREYQNFVSTTVQNIAEEIEQKLTQRLIIDPRQHFNFDAKKLMAYNVNEIVSSGTAMISIGAMSINELRKQLSMAPIGGGDEHKVLENYIPIEDSGNQKKLEKDAEKQSKIEDGEVD